MDTWVFAIAVPVVLISYFVKKNPGCLRLRFKAKHFDEGVTAESEESSLTKFVNLPPSRTLVLLSIVGYYQPLLEQEFGLAFGYSFENLKKVAKTEGDLLNLSLFYLSKKALLTAIEQQNWPITKADLDELPAELHQAQKWLNERRLKAHMLSGAEMGFPKEPLFRM